MNYKTTAYGYERAGLDYEQIAWIHKFYTGEKLSKEMFEWILRKQLKHRREL